MEYAEQLPSSQSKRTIVASLAALAIGAAAASGVWALAGDDGADTASRPSGAPAATEDPGSLYGTSQYRPTYPPQPVEGPSVYEPRVRRPAPSSVRPTYPPQPVDGPSAFGPRVRRPAPSDVAHTNLPRPVDGAYGSRSHAPSP
jgi:hypothetical protein